MLSKSQLLDNLNHLANIYNYKVKNETARVDKDGNLIFYGIAAPDSAEMYEKHIRIGFNPYNVFDDLRQANKTIWDIAAKMKDSKEDMLLTWELEDYEQPHNGFDSNPIYQAKAICVTAKYVMFE